MNFESILKLIPKDKIADWMRKLVTPAVEKDCTESVRKSLAQFPRTSDELFPVYVIVPGKDTVNISIMVTKEVDIDGKRNVYLSREVKRMNLQDFVAALFGSEQEPVMIDTTEINDKPVMHLLPENRIKELPENI